MSERKKINYSCSPVDLVGGTVDELVGGTVDGLIVGGTADGLIVGGTVDELIVGGTVDELIVGGTADGLIVGGVMVILAHWLSLGDNHCPPFSSEHSLVTVPPSQGRETVLPASISGHTPP